MDERPTKKDQLRSRPPTFVDRRAAAAELSISTDTFDRWVADGFLPKPCVNRGQIRLWHWPSIEKALAGANDEVITSDPFVERVKAYATKTTKSRNGAVA